MRPLAKTPPTGNGHWAAARPFVVADSAVSARPVQPGAHDGDQVSLVAARDCPSGCYRRTPCVRPFPAITTPVGKTRRKSRPVRAARRKTDPESAAAQRRFGLTRGNDRLVMATFVDSSQLLPSPYCSASTLYIRFLLGADRGALNAKLVCK
jgi:hypothetical protein